MTYNDAVNLAAVVFWTGIAMFGASLLALVASRIQHHRAAASR